MKTAIIVTGGKQYRVAEGDVIFVEKLDVAAGETVKFDQVLAVVDGETAQFGAPAIEGASVTANVLKNGRSAKIRVYKMKPKRAIVAPRAIVSLTPRFRLRPSTHKHSATDFD